MAASDHLSGPQFFHGTKHEFKPGDTLSVEGANVAKYGQAGYEQRLARGWQDKHIYYADHSGLGEMGIYAGNEGGQGHVYAVQPETKTGKPVTKNSPDPHYKDYPDIGAYRTTGNLRVTHEVDRHGNPL